ncbi:MAG: 3-methyl-2-oxobutanoate hydroxymethyltransferase [Candidatus Omnitrophota bacterium]
MDKKITVLDFKKKKEAGQKISMLTAYDYLMARVIDESGVDAVLVGDSLGMTALGYDSTIGVTMDEMIHHSKAVRRGVARAFLIGDMPFMSYQASDEDAARNAGRFIKEAGCQAVKIEGGSEICSRVMAIVNSGIPVLGHIGLIPQSLNKLGGYRVQGNEPDEAERLTRDAVKLEESGCFALVLECVPSTLARRITEQLSIPTIGIGAGRYCNGQVLVTDDIIGRFDKFVPKFVKQYAKISNTIQNAVKTFKKEVDSGAFPSDEHSF